MATDSGGPAFPVLDRLERYEGRDGDVSYEAELAGGMSLRDYFAGKALEGMRAHPANERPAGIAIWAYEVADAMVARRRETEKE